MGRRAWFAMIAVAGAVGCVYVSFWSWLGDIFQAGDYPGPPCNGCDSAGPPIGALIHGHLGGFFSTQPFMGSVSLLLRAPFVALVDWSKGDIIIQYRFGMLVCLLATLMLLLPAIWLMLRRGQHPLVVIAVVAAVVVGPVTFKAAFWGHPEEFLGAALAVAAVLAAIHRKAVAAGVLLGLAIATKQWGLFAVLPALTVAGEHRRRVALIAGVVAGVFILPMVAGDPGRFFDQNFHTAVAQLGATPTNAWWPFHHQGFDPSVHKEIEVISAPLRELSHPLALVLVFGLSVLYWRRGAERHPYDAVKLLALLFLLRCVLDPLTISYHHAPFILTLAIFEGLRRRGIPLLTLISTAMILFIDRFAGVVSRPDLANAVYLAWTLPTIAYLSFSCLRRKPLGNPARLLGDPAVVQPALANA